MLDTGGRTDEAWVTGRGSRATGLIRSSVAILFRLRPHGLRPKVWTCRLLPKIADRLPHSILSTRFWAASCRRVDDGFPGVGKGCFCLPAWRVQRPAGRHRKLGKPPFSAGNSARKKNKHQRGYGRVGRPWDSLGSDREAHDGRESRQAEAMESPDMASNPSIRKRVRPPPHRLFFSSSPSSQTSIQQLPLRSYHPHHHFSNTPFLENTPQLHQDAVLHPHHLGPCRYRSRRSH